MKAREVLVALHRVLEIYVETHNVQKWKVKVFCRRVVHVSYQRCRILDFGHAVQPLEKFLYASAAVPAHDRTGDFTTNCVTQDRRMSSARLHGLANAVFNRTDVCSIIQERYVLLPGHPDHDTQVILASQVEKPLRRYGVSADGVSAVCGNPSKVRRYGCGLELAPGLIGAERAVGNSTNVEFLVSEKQELAPGAWALATDATVRDVKYIFGHTATPLITFRSARLSWVARAISSGKPYRESP